MIKLVRYVGSTFKTEEVQTLLEAGETQLLQYARSSSNPSCWRPLQKKQDHSELKPQGEAKLVVCGFSGIGASISYAPHGTPESQQSSIDRFG